MFSRTYNNLVNNDTEGDSMTTRRRAGKMSAPSLVMAAALAGGSLTACGAEEEVVPYCVDEDDVIVDERYCEDDGSNSSSGGPWFFMVGPYNAGLQPGTRLDSGMGSRINPTDPAARQKAGLPETGKVTVGKSGSYFKPGGFGTLKGSSGS